MSYSVEQKCGDCAKQSKCADGLIIRNAVQGLIHQLPSAVHLGAGTVTHDCTYGFEPKAPAQS